MCNITATEVHKLVDGFDFSFRIQHMFSESLGRSVGPEVYVDSRTLLKFIEKECGTTESRLKYIYHRSQRKLRTGRTEETWLNTEKPKSGPRIDSEIIVEALTTLDMYDDETMPT